MPQSDDMYMKTAATTDTSQAAVRIITYKLNSFRGFL